MRCQRVFVLGWALLVIGSACTHDYDALREEPGPDIRAGQGGRSGAGGTSGSGGAGASGTGGTAGSAGAGGAGEGGGGAGGGAGACEPCEELSAPAMELGLVSCCRGLARDECGLAVDDGAQCLSRDVAGEDDTSCPPVGPIGMRHEGCCRADARCGARFDMLGLGCVAREDIPDVIAPNADAMPCQLPCAQDADCTGVPDVTAICVPKRDMTAERYCAVQCQRDADCAAGLVCALSPDAMNDRLVLYCQPPVGDRETAEECAMSNQCVHASCLRLDGESSGHCSQPCEDDSDCPASREFCVLTSLDFGADTPFEFDACSTRDN